MKNRILLMFLLICFCTQAATPTWRPNFSLEWFKKHPAITAMLGVSVLLAAIYYARNQSPKTRNPSERTSEERAQLLQRIARKNQEDINRRINEPKVTPNSLLTTIITSSETMEDLQNVLRQIEDYAKVRQQLGFLLKDNMQYVSRQDDKTFVIQLKQDMQTGTLEVTEEIMIHLNQIYDEAQKNEQLMSQEKPKQTLEKYSLSASFSNLQENKISDQEREDIGLPLNAIDSSITEFRRFVSDSITSIEPNRVVNEYDYELYFNDNPSIISSDLYINESEPPILILLLRAVKKEVEIKRQEKALGEETSVKKKGKEEELTEKQISDLKKLAEKAKIAQAEEARNARLKRFNPIQPTPP